MAYDQQRVPFRGSNGLDEEMKKLCAAVQDNGSPKRQVVVQRFRNIIYGQNHSVNVECYGSSSTGLFVKESDVDLVITVSTNQLQEGHTCFLTTIYNYLVAGHRTWGLHTIKMNTAPFPLIKVTDRQSGLEVGIICAEPGSRNSGLQNSEWIRWAITQYPSVAQLVIILKNMLRHNGYPNITAHGISSYVLTLMVISYVQQANQYANLGDLLLGFLEYYGYQFDYKNTAIILTNGGQIVYKCQLRGIGFTDSVKHKLIIQDPVDPATNAAKPSLGGLHNVLGVFQKAHKASKLAGNYQRDTFWSQFLTAEF